MAGKKSKIAPQPNASPAPRRLPDTQTVGKLVGARISVLRLKNRMTLDALARGTGLTSSFLSKLERGQTSVSVDNLQSIASFFGLEAAGFLESGGGEAKAIVTRAGEGTPVRMANTTADVESLVPISRSLVQATQHRTPPGGGRSIAFAHPGEEICYVISGQIRYWVADQTFDLGAGDTIWHASPQPHRYLNVGTSVAVTLHVNTPPVWFHLEPTASKERRRSAR